MHFQQAIGMKPLIKIASKPVSKRDKSFATAASVVIASVRYEIASKYSVMSQNRGKHGPPDLRSS